MSNALTRIKRLVNEIGDLHGMQEEQVSNSFAHGEKVESITPAPSRLPGRVNVELSGSVILEVKLESKTKSVELRRLNHSLEIRCADGKAFHIPLKDVA